MDSQPPVLMTSGQVARLFDVDPATVRRWANSGVLRSVRVGTGHRRYLADEVHALYRVSWYSRKGKLAQDEGRSVLADERPAPAPVPAVSSTASVAPPPPRA